MSEEKITVMLCYARSGGTLLNRCLLQLPETFVLSEVNPKGNGSGSAEGIEGQAKNWYGIDVEKGSYASQINQVWKACQAHGKRLIIRDWPFIDFPDTEDLQPGGTLGTLQALEQASLPYQVFAFVRDSIDVWLSRRTDLERFFASHRKYVETITDLQIPLYRYEDLCENPEATLRSLCSAMSLPFSEAMLHFADEKRVNGDIQAAHRSRGFKQSGFASLKRRRIPSDQIQLLNANQDMVWINRTLGYAPQYNTRSVESRLASVRNIARSRFGKSLRHCLAWGRTCLK